MFDYSYLYCISNNKITAYFCITRLQEEFKYINNMYYYKKFYQKLLEYLIGKDQ